MRGMLYRRWHCCGVSDDGFDELVGIVMGILFMDLEDTACATKSIVEASKVDATDAELTKS